LREDIVVSLEVAATSGNAAALASFGAQQFAQDVLAKSELLASPLDAAMAQFREAQTPLAQGEALRQIDALTGGRTMQVAAKPGDPSGPGRVDDARNTGRGDVRPTLGNGAAIPPKIADAPGFPAFPTPPAAPKTGDGSGVHGAKDPSIGDRLFKQVAYRAADAADAIGMNNAARHMRHYLGNSGATVNIDPSKLRDAIPRIGTAMDANFNSQVRDVALAKVKAEYTGKPMQFQITTPWKNDYATKGESQDWFYAVGGFSYAHTATVTVTPGKDGSAQVHIDSKLNVFDRYNWDGGKSVKIGPITVTDDQMGELHKTGIAREFEVRGTSGGPSADVTVAKGDLPKPKPAQ
jgi:hypothetical protein